MTTLRISWYALFVWLMASNVLVVLMTVSRESAREDLAVTTTFLFATKDGRETKYSRLARQDSGGFFDDITDDEWEAFYRQRARTHQPYRDEQNPNVHADKVPFWTFHNWDPYFTCPRGRRMGGKWMCDPDRIKHKARDGTSALTPPCLIYHVTTTNQSSQEESLEWVKEIAIYFGNACEIHVFGMGFMDNHPELETVHVHEWNVLGESHDESSNHENALLHAQERLGHQHQTIDILSLDCHGCEWTWFPALLAAIPNQVLLQTHDLPLDDHTKTTAKFGTLPRMAPSVLFDAFRAHGYVLYAKEVLSATEECLETNWSFLRLERSFWEMS